MSERTSPGRTSWTPSAADDGSELHRQIDRAYDKAETFVTGLGRAFGVDTSGGIAPCQVAPAPASRAIPAREVRALPAASQPFEIVEVMGTDGNPSTFIVTNGHETAKCPTRAIAQAVLEHIQKATA
jgi:hypothetical protein